MHVLLTNDDGVDAPGLEALFAAVRAVIGSQARITIAAPDRCRSECGHSVTTGRPLQVSRRANGWFAIDGTPVDCVRVALSQLAPDVDLVFSGVNAGANLGIDLLVSGTFAAAREAACHGLPAMAISHYRHPDVPKTWEHVPRWAASTLSRFIEMADRPAKRNDGTPGLLWNVNLPAIDPSCDVPPTVHCSVDRCPIERIANPNGQTIELKADFHGRPRAAGSDVDHCFGGKLTISEMSPF